MTIENLETFDGYAHLRNGLRALADERAEWAGLPMPLQALPLVIEPTFPNAKKLMAIRDTPEDDGTEGGRYRERNWFYSRKHQVDVVVIEDTTTGKVHHGWVPAVHSLDKQIATLDASRAWGIEQEANAIKLLGTLLRHHLFKAYLLTGMFVETSPRSGVTYLFRKLRPTVAMRPSKTGDGMRILACLCMHPIAYYANSWGGAMCPTDDVIAHLMLMRGDEAMFWRRSNQHPAHRPEAGL